MTDNSNEEMQKLMGELEKLMGELEKLIELITKLLAEKQKPKPVSCGQPIKLSMDGKTTTAAPDEVTAIAQASKDAQDKLTRFGEKWCTGSCAETPGTTCKPVISDLTVTSIKTTEVGSTTPSGTSTWSAQVTVTALISCECL